jgi:hypothetical protein
MKSVKDKVWYQAYDQVWNQISVQGAGQVRDRVWIQVSDQVSDQVDQVCAQVSDQVWLQVGRRILIRPLDQNDNQLTSDISGNLNDIYV